MTASSRDDAGGVFGGYPDSLLRALCGPRMTEQEHPVGDRVYRALYMPSFNPECVVTVDLDAAGTGLLTLSGFTGNLWQYRSVQAIREKKPGAVPDAPDAEPTIQSETVELPAGLAERCSTELSQLNASLANPTRQQAIRAQDLPRGQRGVCGPLS